MTAPGDHLEFQASGEFRDRVAGTPEVLEAVKAALRRDPRFGVLLADEFFAADLRIGSEQLVLFYRRRRNVIGLLAVFMKDEETRIDAKRRELCQKQPH